jgi:rubrerythrin
MLSDVSYDILTALQSKLEAVWIYEEYMEDCQEAQEPECQRVFEEIMRDDQRHAEMLRDTLERLVRENKFR